MMHVRQCSVATYSSSTVIARFVNMQIVPAIDMASSAISRADKLECFISAFAAANANGVHELFYRVLLDLLRQRNLRAHDQNKNSDRR